MGPRAVLDGFLTGAENFAPPGFDPRTLQPVASRYTDCAVPALMLTYYRIKSYFD